MSEKLYDEKFNAKRVTKIRKFNQTEDTESVNYVQDSDLDEYISKVGFFLGDVTGWEEYVDPTSKYKNRSPKVWVNVYGFEAMVLLESFEYFDAVMEAFLEKQQSNGKSDTEGTKII